MDLVVKNKTLFLIFFFISLFYFGKSSFILAQTNLDSTLHVKFIVPELNKITRKSDSLFQSTFQLEKYVQNIKLTAYSKGYPLFSIDSSSRKENKLFYFGDIGPKINGISFTFDDESQRALKSLRLSHPEQYVKSISTEKLEQFCNLLLKKCSDKGYPFAQINCIDIKQENTRNKVILHINLFNQMKWSKINIVGKEQLINEKFIALYLHITPNEIYNQSDVELIPIRLKQLQYIQLTKPSELLFTPNGVELFLYLEEKPVSSFNGIVGIQQNPVLLKYQLTGDLRLKLLNSLHRGELVELNWRSVNPGSPQLQVNTQLPFIAKTPFGLSGQFLLLKQDSSFLNTTGTFGVNYFLSSGNQLQGFIKSSSSSVLAAGKKNSAYKNANSLRYGLTLSHKQIDYLANPRKGYLWNIEGSAGQRSLGNSDSLQKNLVLSGSFQIEIYWNLYKRNVLKFSSFFESYSAQAVQQNEVLQFGGNTTQRGFLENELRATTRQTTTLEYRYLLDLNSNLFLFFDYTQMERNLEKSYFKDTPLGFGGGISFGTAIGIFSFSYALGKQQNNPVLLRDGKIHFGYISYF